MFKTPPKTPPSQYPSRLESDLRDLHEEEGHITQRAKRRCFSGEVTQDDIDIFKNEIKKMINEIITTQNSRLDKLESHIMEIKNHYADIKTTNTELEKSMTFVSDQLLSLELKITGLEKEHSVLVNKLSTLEEKVDSFDRNIIKTSIEFRNVPKRANETKSLLYDMVSHLSRHLSFDMETINIRDITRQPSKKEHKTSSSPCSDGVRIQITAPLPPMGKRILRDI